MMKDNRGQVSLEYLLIFSISMILVIAFTMPFLKESIDMTFDVSDTIKAKGDLNKLALAIKQVYGQGQGSKQTLNINVEKPVKINIADNYVSSSIKLKNGHNKIVKVNVKSKLKSTSFRLDEGRNTLEIEWVEDSEYMTISKR